MTTANNTSFNAIATFSQIDEVVVILKDLNAGDFCLNEAKQLMGEFDVAKTAVQNLVEEGQRKIEVGGDDAELVEEIDNFYRIQIGQAQKNLQDKKNNVIDYFQQTKREKQA